MATTKNGKYLPYEIRIVSAALYNSDTDKYYIFVYNRDTQKLEFSSWKSEKVEKNLKVIRASGFSNGWPK